MAKVILAAAGSFGDVTPFVGMGAALQSRGHEVTLLTNDSFAALAAQAGLGFRSLGTSDEYEQTLDERKLWKPRHSFQILVDRLVLPALPRIYRHVAELYSPGRTVLVATGLMIGARIAQEKLGVPLATIVPQPIWLRSRHALPRMRRAVPQWIGPWGRRALYRMVDRAADRLLAGPINAFRAQRGLTPIRRVLHSWWLSPQRAIGLWPAWFAGAQPDWPEQLALTGFLPYDERSALAPGDVPARWSESPIVFSPGSAMKQARDFFRVAAEVCRRMRRPGLFITRYRDQLPADLPEYIRHHDYLPLGPLLPRASAVVHHGGLQTVAQALAAGIPQVVRPMNFDQFDNAHRLAALGVSHALHHDAFTPEAVVARLADLLDSSLVASRCRAHAAKFRVRDDMARTCELIEALLGQDGRNGPVG